MARILIVEDDKQLGDFMLMLIEGMGHEVELATSGGAALELLTKFRHDVVFTDVHMEPMNGLQLADKVKQVNPQSVFVFFSGDDSPELQAQGLRRGALEFLHKPIRVDQLKQVMRRALNRAERERSVQAAATVSASAPAHRAPVAEPPKSAAIDLELETWYPGAPFATLRRKLSQMASGSRYALIEAARGMLHEDLWPLLHRASPASGLPLLVRDAKARPVTSLEEVLLPTNQGMLVVLNVEAVPIEIQKGLTEEMRDAQKMRIIATTSSDPDQLMVDETLYSGLYSRLALGSLRLGPLAEREAEIPDMVAAAIRQSPYYAFGAKSVEIDPAAGEALRAHPWPDNLAELWAVANRALGLMKTPLLTLDEVPDRIRGKRFPSLTDVLHKAEFAHVHRVLRASGGAGPAAEVLGVAESELESYPAEPGGDPLFVLKRDLSAPIPVPTPTIERILIIAADEMVRQTVLAALVGRDVEATAVSDGLSAIAAIVSSPRPYSIALLISPLALFDPQELGTALLRLQPRLRLGLLGGRAPDADPAPFTVVAPSFRTGTDAESVVHALTHGMIEQPAA